MHAHTLHSNKKLREEPHKMLSDDKDMSNCFGFDVSRKLLVVNVRPFKIVLTYVHRMKIMKRINPTLSYCNTMSTKL